ncbi:PspC domain-containing protein [Nocardia altamirensis]|uniref:PspC domain-containing protein n=1 Tax=Nocardia altamirensis TaxID=472158 RepID=UPI00114D1043
MTKTSFGDQLQQMWRTRPVRLPRQGPVAGVAAGFAQRYHVDPVLVRVAFVVSAIFGGAGIVLYLLAWLLCSEAGDQASAAESLVGKGHSSQSQTKTIVLIVALAIAVSTMGPIGVGLGGSSVISMALMLAGWWMLHLRHPEPPPGTTSEFSEFTMDGGGLMATGYPGAVFPQGMQRTAAYEPPTTVYTPYTKLPDTYVPEAPVPSSDAETAVLRQDSMQSGDADTVLLRKDPTEAERADAPGESDTGLLSKGTTEVHHSTPPSGPTTSGGTAQTQSSSGSTASADLSGATVSGDRPSGGATASVDASPGRTDTPSLSKSGPDRQSLSGTGPSAALAQPAPTSLGRTTPPSWDPLGVAPLAWDLPEPTPVRTIVAPPPKRQRSRLTPVIIGLAILAAAGAGAAAASGVDWMTPGRVAAVALAVIGLGLVFGAFLRRGYGLLVLTAPLAGFVLLATAIGPIDIDRGAMGDHTWVPTTLTDLDPQYRVNMGSGTLDLRQLNLTENRSVDIDIRMGDFQLMLPQAMTVHTTCTVNMGDGCVSGTTGPNTPGTPVLNLDIDVRAGNVAVHRG